MIRFKIARTQTQYYSILTFIIMQAPRKIDIWQVFFHNKPNDNPRHITS